MKEFAKEMIKEIMKYKNNADGETEEKSTQATEWLDAE